MALTQSQSILRGVHKFQASFVATTAAPGILRGVDKTNKSSFVVQARDPSWQQLGCEAWTRSINRPTTKAMANWYRWDLEDIPPHRRVPPQHSGRPSSGVVHRPWREYISIERPRLVGEYCEERICEDIFDFPISTIDPRATSWGPLSSEQVSLVSTKRHEMEEHRSSLVKDFHSRARGLFLKAETMMFRLTEAAPDVAKKLSNTNRPSVHIATFGSIAMPQFLPEAEKVVFASNSGIVATEFVTDIELQQILDDWAEGFFVRYLPQWKAMVGRQCLGVNGVVRFLEENDRPVGHPAWGNNEDLDLLFQQSSLLADDCRRMGEFLREVDYFANNALPHCIRCLCFSKGTFRYRDWSRTYQGYVRQLVSREVLRENPRLIPFPYVRHLFCTWMPEYLRRLRCNRSLFSFPPGEMGEVRVCIAGRQCPSIKLTPPFPSPILNKAAEPEIAHPSTAT